MKDVLRPYVPEYKGQVTCDDSDCILLKGVKSDFSFWIVVSSCAFSLTLILQAFIYSCKTYLSILRLPAFWIASWVFGRTWRRNCKRRKRNPNSGKTCTRKWYRSILPHRRWKSTHLKRSQSQGAYLNSKGDFVVLVGRWKGDGVSTVMVSGTWYGERPFHPHRLSDFDWKEFVKATGNLLKTSKLPKLKKKWRKPFEISPVDSRTQWYPSFIYLFIYLFRVFNESLLIYLFRLVSAQVRTKTESHQSYPRSFYFLLLARSHRK